MKRLALLFISIPCVAFASLLLLLSSPGGFTNFTSLHFDGSTSYLSAPANNAIKPAYNTQWWSSIWLLSNQSTGQPTILDNLDSTDHGLYVLLDSGKFRAGLWATPSFRVEVKTTTTVADNVWHHIVMVNSGAGGAAAWTIYIDGVSDTLTTVIDNLGTNDTTSTATFTMGADLLGVGGSAEDFYSGYLNQFAFTQGATLNSTQVTNLYHAGVPISYSGLSPGVWQYLIASTDTLTSNGLKDHAGAGMNMTPHGMTSSNIVTNTRTGVFNRNSLKANSSLGTAVSCGAGTDLQVEKTDSFSFNFWVYVASASLGLDMSFMGNSPSGGYGGWNVAVNASPAGRLQWEFDGTTPNEFFGIQGNAGDLTLNAWANLCGTYSGGNTPNNMILYQNGSQVSTSTYGSVSSLSGTLKGGFPLSIAAQGNPAVLASQYVNGWMDEVTFWRTTLSASDCQTLWNNGHPVVNANVLSSYGASAKAYWRFEFINLGDQASNIKDRKGSNNCTSNSNVTFDTTVP